MPIKPHAFVVMPFGSKPGPDGTLIDFNRVYADYIAPALRDAGMEVFRADQEQRAGEIRSDMFQELLIADLVVADLTINNPNVWYELGVRHALRSRGVVLVSGGQVPAAFDVYTDRKLRYSLEKGAPAAATLEDEKRQLGDMVKATMESWQGRKVSPVYNLLPNLQEPDWKSLKVGDVREFWEKHEQWANRIELARKAGRIGDLLVLADEAPVAAFRGEAYLKAGEALRRAERFDFALEQLERGLTIEPSHLKSLREKGMCLQRLALMGYPGHSLDRAIEHYRSVLEAYPQDPETWALLGRVQKDRWTKSWRRPGSTPETMRDDAAYEDSLLKSAVDSYVKAFRANPSHYYSGINALTLMCLYQHLTKKTSYDADIPIFMGAVRFGAQCEPDERQIFWARATLGDIEVLFGNPDTVKDAYKSAIASNENDWFALNSSSAQLQLLRDIGFRQENVDAGIATFERALRNMAPPEAKWQPRQVLLFSGHMIDAPGRAPPRFPPEKEAAAAQRIDEALAQLGADGNDAALCQAAAGGDILFLEACLKRGIKCSVMLPFPEPEFIERSILPSQGGEKWRDRYYALVQAINARSQVMPEHLGPLPKGVDAFERCNLWLLNTALAAGVDKVRFICLWNGSGGDGPGGTAHLYAEVKRRTGRVTWIDARTL